jgi:hypothetical protein
MKSAPTPPSRSDVEERFAAVLDHSQSRDEVDRWAARWVAADDPDVADADMWWGLLKLCGIDLRHGPDMPYLHDDEQIAEWLAEFRRRGEDRA